MKLHQQETRTKEGGEGFNFSTTSTIGKGHFNAYSRPFLLGITKHNVFHPQSNLYTVQYVPDEGIHYSFTTKSIFIRCCPPRADDTSDGDMYGILEYL